MIIIYRYKITCWNYICKIRITLYCSTYCNFSTVDITGTLNIVGNTNFTNIIPTCDFIAIQNNHLVNKQYCDTTVNALLNTNNTFIGSNYFQNLYINTGNGFNNSSFYKKINESPCMYVISETGCVPLFGSYKDNLPLNDKIISIIIMPRYKCYCYTDVGYSGYRSDSLNNAYENAPYTFIFASQYRNQISSIQIYIATDGFNFQELPDISQNREEVVINLNVKYINALPI